MNCPKHPYQAMVEKPLFTSTYWECSVCEDALKQWKVEPDPIRDWGARYSMHGRSAGYQNLPKPGGPTNRDYAIQAGVDPHTDRVESVDADNVMITPNGARPPRPCVVIPSGKKVHFRTSTFALTCGCHGVVRSSQRGWDVIPQLNTPPDDVI